MNFFKKHYNIPIFIPEAACPHRCVFCNQHHITERAKQPSVTEIVSIIQKHLLTIPTGNEVEIAFFGGSFTGLETAQQKAYLSAVQPFLKTKQVGSIRCSTRPDYISDSSVELLQLFGVKMVELGVQSFDDDVLFQSNRGHSAQDIYDAVEILKKHKMPFGLQMMTGLPGDTPEKTMRTAREIVRLNASNTRIYPCLVIKHTQLERLFNEGRFQPQTMPEAIDLCAQLVTFFEDNNIKILRVGLHSTEGFNNRTTLIAGPYHSSFNELVESRIWGKIFAQNIDIQRSGKLIITVPKGTAGMASGHCQCNRKQFEQHFKKIQFKEDEKLSKRTCYVHYC